MKAVIQVRKEGKWYVATDFVTQVADQGRTKEQATENLLEGLRQRYQILLERSPRKGVRVLEVEV